MLFSCSRTISYWTFLYWALNQFGSTFKFYQRIIKILKFYFFCVCKWLNFSFYSHSLDCNRPIFFTWSHLIYLDTHTHPHSQTHTHTHTHTRTHINLSIPHMHVRTPTYTQDDLEAAQREKVRVPHCFKTLGQSVSRRTCKLKSPSLMPLLFNSISFFKCKNYICKTN